jgi:hypothetical protein
VSQYWVFLFFDSMREIDGSILFIVLCRILRVEWDVVNWKEKKKAEALL